VRARPVTSAPVPSVVHGGHRAGTEETIVLIDKGTLLQFLTDHGVDDDEVQQARPELPDEVDTDNDAELLKQLGIDVQKLLGKLGGLEDLGKKFAL
jgi:hypothetical protein